MFGAISRGTERLVYRGQVPPSEYQRMRAPHMGGSFPFPVKYGYATVGRVEAGPDELRDREIFALYPHQTRFNLAADAVIPLPAGVSPQRAVLAANMETALNAVWDGAPGPADRIGIVGGGLLGLLVAYLCSRLPGAEVTVIDVDPSRAQLAAALGARFAEPAAAPADCDLVFHASATRGGSHDGVADCRRRGDGGGVELVRRGRYCGAAGRIVPQSAAAAGFESGRQGGAIAPAALELPAAACGRAGAAGGRDARCAAGAGDCVRRLAGAPAGCFR